MKNKKQDLGLRHREGATNIEPRSYKKEESNQGTSESQVSIPENWAAGYYGLHNVDKTKWIEAKPLKKMKKKIKILRISIITPRIILSFFQSINYSI